jgi:hypothetical protein
MGLGGVYRVVTILTILVEEEEENGPEMCHHALPL